MSLLQVSTFNLILVLEEERPLSVAIKNWLKQFAGAKVDHMVRYPNEGSSTVALLALTSNFCSDKPSLLTQEGDSLQEFVGDHPCKFPNYRPKFLVL